jgi:hypothetical protein
MNFIYFIVIVTTALPINGGEWTGAVKTGIDNRLHSIANSQTTTFATLGLKEALPKLNPAAKEFAPIGHVTAPRPAVAPPANVNKGISLEDSILSALKPPWKKLNRPFALEEIPIITAAKQDSFHSNLQAGIAVSTLKSVERFADPLAALPWKPLRRPFALEESPSHSVRSDIVSKETIPDKSDSSVISNVDKFKPIVRMKKKKIVRSPQSNSAEGIRISEEWKLPHWEKSTIRKNLPEMKQNNRWDFSFTNVAENNRKANEYEAFKRDRKREGKLAFNRRKKDLK